MEAKRLDAPWEACGQYIRTMREADGSGGFLVAEVPANTGRTTQVAEFIALACNAHDDLVKALQLFVKYDDSDHDNGFAMMTQYADAISAARAALAKAGA